jgi:hypothetical protein
MINPGFMDIASRRRPAHTRPMPASRPILDPLREALIDRSVAEPIRSIADAAGIDYRKLLNFSQGGPAAFDALDVDRLAAHLGLRLGYDVDEPKPPTRKVPAKG